MLEILNDLVFNIEKTYHIYLIILLISGIVSLFINIKLEIKEHERIMDKKDCLAAPFFIIVVSFFPVLNAIIVLIVIGFSLFYCMSIIFEIIIKGIK